MPDKHSPGRGKPWGQYTLLESFKVVNHNLYKTKTAVVKVQEPGGIHPVHPVELTVSTIII